MKVKSRKVMAITGVVALLASGAAAGVGYYHSNATGNGMNLSKTGKLSAAGQEEVVNKLKQLNTTGYRPTELEKELKKSIDQMDTDQSTKAVHELMKSMDTASSYFTNVLYVMGPELEYTKIADGVKDPLKEESKMSDKIAKGYIDEVNRQHLQMLEGNGYYHIEINAKYILDTYGDYITSDYKNYVNLAAKQQSSPIFDEKTSMYNLDHIRDNLVAIEHSRDKWSKGNYAQDYTNLELKLYEAMFCVNQATFFDQKAENEGQANANVKYTLKDDVRKKYEKLIKENKDMPFAKELQDFLNVLKDNNYELNDKVDSFLKDMFTKKFGDSLTQGNGSATTTSGTSSESAPLSEATPTAPATTSTDTPAQ